jgi:hypothetical protein
MRLPSFGLATGARPGDAGACRGITRGEFGLETEVTTRASHSAIQRRPEVALMLMLAILGLWAAVIFWIWAAGPIDLSLPVIALAMGLTLLGIVGMIATGVRRQTWTVAPEGLQIEDAPRPRWLGRTRRTTLSFGEIAGLARRQAGFVPQLQVTATDGRRFTLTRGNHTPTATGIGLPDVEGFEAFTAELDAALAGAEREVSLAEVPGFLQTPVGLAVQVMLFAFALAIAAGTIWSVFASPPTPRPRMGEILAVLVLLPVGAGWLLRTSLRRRRALRQQGAGDARHARN